MSGDGSRQLFKAVRFDACAFAAVLAAFAVTFYLHWDFWDDQAAQAYMAWGLFHGMKPYVDLVDPNWPGILLPHALAYLVAGTDAWGLRALDLIFVYALLTATSVVLAAWGTPPAMRLVAGCSYLTTYFATGWMWTAQRESFCWPLFVIGSIPLLLRLGPRDEAAAGEIATFSGGAWFGFGAIAGLALWIKPTPLLALAFLLLAAAVFCDPEERRDVLRGIGGYLLGIAAVSIAFVGALAVIGALGGFIKWGIDYDLGSYSRIKFPWRVRLHVMFEFLTDPRLRPVSWVLGAVGGIVAICYPRAQRQWPRRACPILISAGLVAAGALSIFLQGKPGSLYHFIPLEWALAAFAGVIWSIIPWTKRLRDGAMFLSLMIVALTIYKEPQFAGTTAGTKAGRQLNAELGPDDEVVEWGYSPTLLLQAQRRTPFMTFIATAFLVTSPPDSWAAHEVLDRLNRALRDPAVRYLLVERLPNYRIQQSTPKFPIDYLAADPAISRTLVAEYHEVPQARIEGFEVFFHTTKEPRPTTIERSPR